MFPETEVAHLAKLLGYKKFERLCKLERADPARLATAVQSCTTTAHSLFFAPGWMYEISPYGFSVHRFWNKSDIHITQNYLVAFPNLDEKFLRTFFTGLEFIIFKLCHIVIENNRHGYHFETTATRHRIKKLKPHLGISKWNEYYALFDDVMFVRDAFAHSFVEIAKIKYKGVPLSQCFGHSYLGRQPRPFPVDNPSIFMDGVMEMFAPIEHLYMSCQLKQFDTNKLFILLDNLLKDRSLDRT